jgi:hypothetical protein
MWVSKLFSGTLWELGIPPAHSPPLPDRMMSQSVPKACRIASIAFSTAFTILVSDMATLLY